MTAERSHIGIGLVQLAAGKHPLHPATGRAQRSDRDTVTKDHTSRRAMTRQLLRETVRVTRLVGRRVVGADEQRACRRQCRFDGDALVHTQGAPLAAMLAHQRRGPDRRRELATIGVQVQDTALELIVGQRHFGAQRLQLGSTVERQADDLAHIGMRSPGRALAQEAQHPVEQGGIAAQPEPQRRVLAPHPGECAPRGAGVGPRFGVRHRNLAAVGETGFQPGCRLPVEDADLVPRSRQIPGSADADDAGAKDEHLQAGARRCSGRGERPRRGFKWPVPARGQCGPPPADGEGCASVAPARCGRPPGR